MFRRYGRKELEYLCYDGGIRSGWGLASHGAMYLGGSVRFYDSLRETGGHDCNLYVTVGFRVDCFRARKH